MNIVRLNVSSNNSKEKILLIIVVLIAIVILLLVFNPFKLVKDNFESKRQESLAKTPEYESLKTISFSKNNKYYLPVRLVTSTQVNNNVVKINADPKADVRSVSDGFISSSGYDPTYGNYIEVSDCGIYKEEVYLFYGNLSNKIDTDIIVVQEREKLGEVGDSGYVYFMIKDKNHKVLNPYEYMNLSK